MNSFKLSLSNLIMLLTVFVFNFLTGSGRINDLSQGDISAMFPTMITPAGFAFSIWGVIYTLVIIAIALMLFKHKEAKTSKLIQATGWWFNLSALANILWTLAFSYLMLPLSSLLIALLLFALMMILIQLTKLNIKVSFIFPLAFGMYAGWVMIATVVNIAASLVQINWNGFGLSAMLWANIILIVALFIVLFVTYHTTNAIIPLPIAWAYFAIYQAETSTVSLIGIFVLIAIAFYQLYRNKFALQQAIK